MLCVIAKLDKSSRARLSWIQSFAASFGLVPKPIYGHVTLVSFETGDEGALIAACKEALAGQETFPVSFQTVDILPPTSHIAALAAREGALDGLQEKLAALFPDDLNHWTRRENWVPHTTLLREEKMNMSWVRTAMVQMFQPFTGRVDTVEFSRVTAAGYEIIDRVELKGEAV